MALSIIADFERVIPDSGLGSLLKIQTTKFKESNPNWNPPSIFMKKGGEKKIGIELKLLEFLHDKNIKFYFFTKYDLLVYLSKAKEEFLFPTRDYINKKFLYEIYDNLVSKVSNLSEEIFIFNAFAEKDGDNSRAYIQFQSSEDTRIYSNFIDICLSSVTSMKFQIIADSESNNKFVNIKPIFNMEYSKESLNSLLNNLFDESNVSESIYYFIFKYGNHINDLNGTEIFSENIIYIENKSVFESAFNTFLSLKQSDVNLGYSLPSAIEVLSSYISHWKSEEEPLQLIYYGAPGTGKSHSIDGVVSEDNSVRTTFHPDSDYASFVGAYKPTMKDVSMSAFVGKEVHKAQPQGGHPGTEQKIVYKYVPQAFLKAYVQAWMRYNPENDEPYYLVIEEINRGNCAQIFGDLFQLLDRNNMGASSYPISADDDIEQFLATDEKGFAGFSEEQKDVIRNFVLVKDNGKTESIGQSILNGSKLLLPPNLRIWATMNTSDQSLFPIDSAFKRRWNWKYMPIEYNPVDHNGNTISWAFNIGESQYSWGDFLKKINPEIYSLTESSDKQMGYFFAKADPQTGIISEDVFLNKVLFYLWTDVFKDYDVSSAVFKNKKENRSFRFTDFFEDPEALGNFIENLGLLPLDENDNIGDLEESNSVGFSLNGEALSLKDIANKVVSTYATEHPELTGEAIRDTFVSLCKGIGVSHIVESDEDYQKRRHQPSAERSRTAVILPNGETIHVTTQWRANKPDSNFIKFIEICKEHNLGIIERIVE